MPTQWMLELAVTGELADEHRFDVLHAIACAFFEHDGSDHNADDKPFVVRLTSSPVSAAQLTLTWLPDVAAPVSAIPTVLRLGSARAEVTGVASTTSVLDDLASGLSDRVRLRVVSPAKFRHNGNDYPLPDPHLVYAGLARRLQALQPAGFEDRTVRDLARSVVIYRHDIRTVPFFWHGRRSAGFVGRVTFGVPATSTSAVRALFARLNGFAGLAGIGHGTTHGLGAVDLGG